jgi:hypothetical protein
MPLYGLLLILTGLLLIVVVVAVRYRNTAFLLGFCAALVFLGIPGLFYVWVDTAASVERTDEHERLPAPVNSPAPPLASHRLV